MNPTSHRPARSGRRFRLTTWVFALAAPLLLGACAGSTEGAGGGGTPSVPPPREPAGELNRAPDLPVGKFTVQLGAFQSGEGASAVADLARSRFAREVYTVRDARDGLYKVMLGVFDTKELARTFRDSIVRQFPQEYNDAWVSDLAR